MFEVKIKQLSAAKEDTDKKVIENETKTKMTARQPHGETTNVTEQTSSRSTSSQKRRSSKQQQGRHPERHAEWEMQQNSKFYNSQDEEQGL